MAEKPSVKQILETYYALRASGVQRFPKPLSRSELKTRPSGGCLFLYDFPTVNEPEGGVPPILRRLLERLPWRSGVEVAAALESQPKTAQLDPVGEAIVVRLRERIAADKVQRIVCFGWRAGHVLSIALGQPFSVPPQAFEPLFCESEGLGGVEILVFPDVRELEAFPEWRALVWESLVNFAPK